MKVQIKQHEIEVALQDPTVLAVPKNSKLLKIHSSNGEHIYAWFLEAVDEIETETYHFYTIPTNWEFLNTHPVITNPTIKYFNTVFIRDGEIVFHVFYSKTNIDPFTTL